ncbi:hypothetical protein D918_03007 [Trichuris suis]|nr:hypothetical protein D918_03007 [Trichuris suis]
MDTTTNEPPSSESMNISGNEKFSAASIGRILISKAGLRRPSLVSSYYVCLTVKNVLALSVSCSFFTKADL